LSKNLWAGFDEEKKQFTSTGGAGGAADPTGCYSFPDQGTINTLNKVFAALKKKGYIVTLVPVSTAMYSNDKTLNQNQFVKYGINHKNIDGIMLQWYSGAGINICPKTKEGKQGLCNDSTISTQCDTKSGAQGTNAERMKNLTSTLAKLKSSSLAKQPYWPKTDSIKGGSSFGTNYGTGVNAANLGRCPYKCPRKEDCPDWAYTNEPPFASQVKLLRNLKTWIGSEDDFSKKIVIGLEGFPNFPGEIKMGSGTFPTWTQFWGPVPSAQAVVGLDAAIKGNKEIKKVAKNGIAGIGIYTANTAFVNSTMQFGGKTQNIYKLLTPWKSSIK